MNTPIQYDRISSSIDINRMQASHVTLIGGAYGMAKDLAKCGLGRVSLTDFDRIDQTNPARQDFYIEDVGRRKIEAAAVEIRRNNPDIEIETHARDFCELSRESVDAMYGGTDVFVLATDWFPAQARGCVEATRLQKPAVWIGLYAGGRAGEIIFYVPGQTACFRCVASARYAAFKRRRQDVEVPSTGGTILDLRLTDAIASQIVVGLLTRGAENRFGRLVERLGQRNLLQVKIDPDYTLGGKDIFAEHLGETPANVTFTTIALHTEIDPNCPDCQVAMTTGARS